MALLSQKADVQKYQLALHRLGPTAWRHREVGRLEAGGCADGCFGAVGSGTGVRAECCGSARDEAGKMDEKPSRREDSGIERMIRM